MSFIRVPKDKLITFLDETNSGVDTSQNKPEILKEIEDKDIDFAEYTKWFNKKKSEQKPEPKEEPKEEQKDYVKQDNKTLVRMTANYSTFVLGGHTFTEVHPFAIMTTDEASFLIDNREGFEYATKEDAKKYYGDK